MKLSKGTITLLVIAGVVVLLLLWTYSTFNKLVKQEEIVTTAWSQVENVYQRRADLIPNLVNTVKGYAKHEQTTFESVVEARSKATQITVDPNDLSAEKLAEFQKAQGELSAALGKLLMIQEQYPDLKANQNFLELQSQLEGTENRITTERQKFNEATKKYNIQIRLFPGNILASQFGFEKKVYFEAAEGAENAPVVEF